MSSNPIKKIVALKEPLTYLLVGLANTLVTAGIIFGLMALHVHVLIANAIGYAVGLGVSFQLNSMVTFKVKMHGSMLLRFLLVAAAAYAANVLTVIMAMRLTGSQHWAQIPGMVVYTVLGYCGNKYWAMRK